MSIMQRVRKLEQEMSSRTLRHVWVEAAQSGSAQKKWMERYLANTTIPEGEDVNFYIWQPSSLS